MSSLTDAQRQRLERRRSIAAEHASAHKSKLRREMLCSDQSAAERQRIVAKESARVYSIASRFLARARPLDVRPTSAAIVYFHASLHAERNEDNLSEVVRYLLETSEAARGRILIAVLEALARAPLDAPSWRVNVHGNLRFVHDHHWGKLIAALLRRRLPADDAALVAILRALAKLADRFNSNYPLSSYLFPFAAIIRFLDRHMPACTRDAVMPAVAELRDGVRKAIVRDLVVMKGYSEAEALTLADEPGKWLVKADRMAVELVEGWIVSG